MAIRKGSNRSSHAIYTVSSQLNLLGQPYPFSGLEEPWPTVGPTYLSKSVPDQAVQARTTPHRPKC